MASNNLVVAAGEVFRAQGNLSYDTVTIAAGGQIMIVGAGTLTARTLDAPLDEHGKPSAVLSVVYGPPGASGQPGMNGQVGANGAPGRPGASGAPGRTGGPGQPGPAGAPFTMNLATFTGYLQLSPAGGAGGAGGVGGTGGAGGAGSNAAGGNGGPGGDGGPGGNGGTGGTITLRIGSDVDDGKIAVFRSMADGGAAGLGGNGGNGGAGSPPGRSGSSGNPGTAGKPGNPGYVIVKHGLAAEAGREPARHEPAEREPSAY
jgi:Collagen triple helix repeat (20 copies)